jgi:hypothetical protein
MAGQRTAPNGGPYGPDTCPQGFVWREAFSGDHVCVTPASRDQARSDNSQAAVRVVCDIFDAGCVQVPDPGTLLPH